MGICMLSLFSIFIVELIAFRWGTAKLAALGIKHGEHTLLYSPLSVLLTMN